MQIGDVNINVELREGRRRKLTCLTVAAYQAPLSGQTMCTVSSSRSVVTSRRFSTLKTIFAAAFAGLACFASPLSARCSSSFALRGHQSDERCHKRQQQMCRNTGIEQLDVHIPSNEQRGWLSNSTRGRQDSLSKT